MERNPGAAALDGVIYVVGGNVPGGVVTDVVETYDTASNTWRSVASLPQVRSDLAVVAWQGRIYAIGGTIDWPGGNPRLLSLSMIQGQMCG